jgi:hypothetical protein
MPIIAGRASAAYGSGFGAVTTIPYQGPFGAYDALATVTVPSGGLASVTFAGIPTGYKHLQIRYSARTANSYQFDFTNMIFNDDSTNNTYLNHMFSGNGASAQSEYFGIGGGLYGMGITAGNTNTSGVFGTGVIDILDYSNTNKNKTIKAFSGFNNNDSNNGRQVALSAGLWLNTQAVNVINLNGNGANLLQNSTFALYGVK